MKKCFIYKKFRKDSLDLLNSINSIIDEYQEQGYELTLRQVYYQLVARGIIPNSERSYKNVGNLINEGRLAGLIDWNAIVDRTRHIRVPAHWNSPEEILEAAISQYRIDTRNTQPYYIEVWVEKDALIGIVEDICRRLDVPCFSCRGYVSQTEMYEASLRFKDHQIEQECLILHLGDHDPSGKDMTRDIIERLDLFGAIVQVERIALNYNQIKHYNPPANPTKLTDSRAKEYIAEFGHTCWELDALEPKVIEQLITSKIYDYTDLDLLEERKEVFESDVKKLKELCNLL